MAQQSEVLMVKQCLKKHKQKLKQLLNAEFAGDVEERIAYRQKRILSNKEWLNKNKAFA